MDETVRRPAPSDVARLGGRDRHLRNAAKDGQDEQLLAFARSMRDGFTRLIMEYQFAVDEILTKVSILREEFIHLHRYNPIEHVTSRIKKPEDIFEKATRRGVEPTFESIREHITDIAGIRITCSFIPDTYRVLEALVSQTDLRVISIKDYISTPKPNGYKSLHAILEIPVFLSTGPISVTVEVQIRTIAMDFWASLEHKIHYKYAGAVPDHLVEDLAEAAATAEQLDRRMEQLHTAVHGDDYDEPTPASTPIIDDSLMHRMWELTRGLGVRSG